MDTKLIQQDRKFDIESLLEKAVEKDIGIESLERFLALREKLKNEQDREAFFSALANFQSECPTIEKRKNVYNKDGKSIRYKYAPIEDIVEQVKKPLKEFGFSYFMKTEQTENSVTAICIVNHEWGHSEETRFMVPVDKSSYMNDQQKFASALTYAKRYAFCNALGIMTGETDDDANGASPPQGEKPKDDPPLSFSQMTKKMLKDAFDNGLVTKEETTEFWKKMKLYSDPAQAGQYFDELQELINDRKENGFPKQSVEDVTKDLAIQKGMDFEGNENV